MLKLEWNGGGQVGPQSVTETKKNITKTRELFPLELAEILVLFESCSKATGDAMSVTNLNIDYAQGGRGMLPTIKQMFEIVTSCLKS